jgi:hypothetical protein
MFLFVLIKSKLLVFESNKYKNINYFELNIQI